MIFVCFLLISFAAYADGFYQDHGRGWHWYEQFSLPEETKPEEKSLPNRLSPSEVVKAYREELESRLHQAWLDPTPAHMHAYQTLQQDMMTRSKAFSTAWMRHVIENPSLDHTLVSPVNQQARHIQMDQDKQRTAETIRGLSTQYGLFFFFSSDCPYCHQFAPTVRRFAAQYDWEVIAISVDGGSLAEFPHAELDNGLSQAWNISSFPALFAVNLQTKSALPLAYGLTSQDDIEHRVMTLMGSDA